METIETREREQHFRFPCPELGVAPSTPSEIPWHTLNYFQAMSWVVDLHSRKTYIDIGCGSGYGTEMLAPFFEKSYGIDRDQLAIEYARKIHARAGTEYLLSPNFETGPFYKAVDFITMIEVLEHVPESLVPVLLCEVQDWLTKEGVLYLTTPVGTTKSGHNPTNHFHQHEYQPAELKALLDKNFNQVHISVRNGQMEAVCADPK